MRLLNVNTLDFEEFVGEAGNGIPPYAILSHTWGPEEVTFKDHAEKGKESTEKKGYEKIRGCCRLAESEGFQYAWIDTCCIDKSSSAELSEAINSMFQWYRDAAICYAYLSDVDGSEDPAESADGDEKSQGSSSFARSRWFTRGWTLQELLAPSEVIFLASDWSEIGTKKSLGRAVSRVTAINEKVLQECRWDEYSVAQKMSWAASRQTTRLEDTAYCLLGLFDVNMPLLYGEGSKAFSRLQQAIMQRTEDQSIFAWSYPDDEHSYTSTSGMMAPSPQYFKGASQIEILDQFRNYQGQFEVVNQLVRLRSRLLDRVQGMELQTYASKPLLHSVVDVQRSGKEPQAPEQNTKDTKSSVDSPCMQEPGGIPSIQITEVAFEDDQVNKIDVDGTSASASSDCSSGVELEAIDLQAEGGIAADFSMRGDFEEIIRADGLVPIGCPTWRWYIYQSLVIAPLRCRIGRSQLGILLSRGSANSVGDVVALRLHHPSIVMLGDVAAKLEAATVQTMYVTISQSRELSKKPSREVSMPEIRYGSLAAAGYRAVRDAGPDWVFDTRQSIVRLHPDAIAREDINYRQDPVILFYHRSGKDSTYPTMFIRLRVSRRNNRSFRRITCDLGIFGPASARKTTSIMEDFRLYSADLLRERGFEVASGHDGHSVAVRLRQGHKDAFVNVSFQKAHHGRLPAPHDISHNISHDISLLPENNLLKTQLHSKLRSARAWVSRVED